MSVKCLLCCRVKRAMQDFEAKLTQELQALKTAISSKDDEMGRLVDGINTQIAGAREGVRAKKDSIRTNETQISRLQAEVNTRPDLLCASSHVPPGVSAPVSYHTVHYWIPYKLMSWLLEVLCFTDVDWGPKSGEQSNAGRGEGEGAPGRGPGVCQADCFGQGGPGQRAAAAVQ